MVHHSQTGCGIASQTDTIAAVATPAGFGGIGVIRISGPCALELTQALAAPGKRPALQPHKAQLRGFYDRCGELIDQGLALYFPAPHSYTGEQVCELQCHGGPVILDTLLSELVARGARLAEPGEYTWRAFDNAKLDLAQAEAVADLINAATAKAARAALRSLAGEFSSRIEQIVSQLSQLRVYVEAAIDFSEEEIDFLDSQELDARVSAVCAELDQLAAQTSAGSVLREGISAVIVGLPNAGKSSLLNLMSGQDRVIVTPAPGTTRDTVDVTVDISGLAVRLTDTAGLRDSRDIVENQGIARAWEAARQADVVLYVIDSAAGVTAEDVRHLEQLDPQRVMVVWNKIDLAVTPDQNAVSHIRHHAFVSALSGEGLDRLLRAIETLAGCDPAQESVFLARRRHVAAIAGARRFVHSARDVLREQRAGELAAQDLHDAMLELGKITKVPASDALLGEIFSSFCIGK